MDSDEYRRRRATREAAAEPRKPKWSDVGAALGHAIDELADVIRRTGRDVQSSERIARIFLLNKDHVRGLIVGMSPEQRAAALILFREQSGGAVKVLVVDLAGFLQQTTMNMSEEERGAFLDASGIETGPTEMRCFVSLADRSGQFWTLNVS